MKWVGGYSSYLALMDDARAFDDVLIAMEAEADWREVQRQRER